MKKNSISSCHWWHLGLSTSVLIPVQWEIRSMYMILIAIHNYIMPYHGHIKVPTYLQVSCWGSSWRWPPNKYVPPLFSVSSQMSCCSDWWDGIFKTETPKSSSHFLSGLPLGLESWMFPSNSLVVLQYLVKIQQSLNHLLIKSFSFRSFGRRWGIWAS